MNKKIFKIKTCRGIEKFVEISSCVDGETKLYLLESVEYGECVPAIIVREKKICHIMSKNTTGLIVYMTGYKKIKYD